MAWKGCAGINLSTNTSPVGGLMRLLPGRYLDGDDPGEGFCWCRLHDGPLRHCMEEAEGRSRRWVRLSLPAHATARRPCRLLGVLWRSWAMEGRWRRQNLEPSLVRTVRTRAVLWQLASDGVWCKLLVAIVLSLPFYLVCGWVCSVAASATNLVRFFVHHRAGQWQELLLVSFGFGGLAVGRCHASYGSFGLVSCWVPERLGQCPARLDSLDLLAGAHARGSLRYERWSSPMLRLYVQEGGLFLRLCKVCTGWRHHFGAICIDGCFLRQLKT